MRERGSNRFASTLGSVVAVFFLVACTVHSTDADKPRPPNIVFILADDLGWADLGCYGHEFHETPNIDSLAARGMRFTDGYAASPVCGPTRASILSGTSPARTGYTHNWLTPNPQEQPHWGEGMPRTMPAFMPLEEFTLAEALQFVGYQTAHVGKWHLGEETHSAIRQGFDLSMGGSHWGHPLQGYFSPYEMPNLGNGPTGEYLTDRLTSEAIGVMEAFSKNEPPWLLYMSYYTVHGPLQGKSDKVSKYERKARGASIGDIHTAYAAMLESLDDNVGRLIQWLDDSELWNSTVVIFTSDNGGWVRATTNKPLRSHKGHLLEGGIRVPWIVWWPGVTKPESVCRKTVISTDFYPTILDMVGVDARPSQRFDGVSFAKVLKGESDFDRGPLVWHYPHDRISKPGSAIRAGDWKFIHYYQDGRQELYNLADDIGESENLAQELPEMANAMKVNMNAILQEHGAIIPSTSLEYR